MKKSSIIEEINNRLGLLEKEAEEDLDKKKPPKKRKLPVDEEVCPVCGNDLLFVEDGIVYCESCNQYYEEESEE